MHVSCESSPSPRWCAVAASAGLAAGAAMPVAAAGREIVVWRALDGSAHAWVDRCPHRGMRLSFGTVMAGGLVCPYHGWRFGTDAQCNHMPAHPDARPKATRADAYAVRETGGLLWVELAADAESSTPDLGELDVVRAMFVPADTHTVIAALAAFPLDARSARTTPLSTEALAAACWTRAPSGVVVEVASGGETLRSRIGSAGTVECTWHTEVATRYVAVVSASDDTGSMLHLAAATATPRDARHALNGSLIAFRQWLASPASSSVVQPMRAALAGALEKSCA